MQFINLQRKIKKLNSNLTQMEEFLTFIMEDDKHLCRAPGIGKKTAGRIILELKDKIKKEDIMSGVDIQEGFEDLQPTVNTNTVGEALGALLALGYSEKEAETALKQVDKTASLEDIIKDCLKVLMG